mmetsp:Transcript_1960/g.1421  ORF Transcript_1960/g.1421 Transcript_1960/m.1421 type:complete len:162 (+) Transcript_1960:1830-2315(+)
MDSEVVVCLQSYLSTLKELAFMKGASQPVGIVLDPKQSESELKEQLESLNQQQIEEIQAFWSTPVDFNDPVLQVDKAPVIVMENSPMAKIHFLFMMLGISSLCVLHRGIITGVITKNEFIKKKKDVAVEVAAEPPKKKVRRVTAEVKEEKNSGIEMAERKV